MFLNLHFHFLLYIYPDDIEATPLNAIQPKNSNLHRSHQHIFQHQSSVSSTASVQTVYQQNILHTSNSNGVGGPMLPLGTSTSSASFDNGNGTANHSGSISSLTSNAILQQMSNSSNVSIAEEALNIGDVADLLHPQYAIITGGRSREGCPLITFPDHNNFHGMTEHDYEKLISYLTSVPP